MDVFFDGQRLVEQGEVPSQVQLGRNGPTPLNLDVQLKPTASVETVDLWVKVYVGPRAFPVASDEIQLRCVKRRPDEVDVLVTASPGRPDAHLESTILPDVTPLRPYPSGAQDSRSTTFLLELVNRSAKPKTVTAHLVAAPYSDEWPPGVLIRRDLKQPFSNLKRQLFQANTTQLLASARILATTAKPIRLEVDQPQPLDLTAAKAETDPPAATAPAMVSPAGDGTDVSAGLVCVITDEQSGKVWIEWLEVQPRSPRDYVQVESDFLNQTLSVRFKPIPGELPEGFSAKDPIAVRWDTAELMERLSATALNPVDAIRGPNDDARVYCEGVQRRPGTTVTLRLDVDGYPRAFLQRIDLGAFGRGDDQDQHSRIQLASLSMEGFDKTYVSIPRPIVDEEAPQEVRLRRDAPAYFRATDKPIPLQVGFQVDAPAQEFGPGDLDDYVQIWLERSSGGNRSASNYGSQGLRFRATRSRTTRMAPFKIPGQMVLKTSVSDFQVPLGVQGNQGAFRIVGQLVVDGVAKKEHSFQQDIVFDATPPEVQTISAPPRVALGKPIRVDMLINDQSAARVDFGLLEDPSMPFPSKPMASTVNLVSRPRNIWELRRMMISGTLIAEANRYWLVTRVTDHVGLQRTSDPIPIVVYRPRVISSSGAGGTPPVALKGNVNGQVVFKNNGKPVGGMTVEIEGFGSVHSDSGDFVVKDVTAGKHEIKASGKYQSKMYQGQQPIKLEKAADYLQVFKVQVDRAE